MCSMEFVIFFIIGSIGNVVGTLVGGGGLISLPAMLLMGLPVGLRDWLAPPIYVALRYFALNDCIFNSIQKAPPGRHPLFVTFCLV